MRMGRLPRWAGVCAAAYLLTSSAACAATQTQRANSPTWTMTLSSWPERASKPKPGARCWWGPMHSSGLGVVLDGRPDRPGPSGNEIKQIYRTFYILGDRNGTSQGLAGWVMQTFNGETWFQPVSEEVARAQGSIAITTFRHADNVPVQSWMKALSRFAPPVGFTPDPQQARLIAAPHVQTLIVPCFAPMWNGR